MLKKINLLWLFVNAIVLVLLVVGCIYIKKQTQHINSQVKQQGVLLKQYKKIRLGEHILKRYPQQLMCKPNTLPRLLHSLSQYPMAIQDIKQKTNGMQVSLQSNKEALVEWLGAHYFANVCVMPVVVSIKADQNQFNINLFIKDYSYEK